MQYTTLIKRQKKRLQLYYQDFKDTFVCNTQRYLPSVLTDCRCIIRISKILLYAIHNWRSLALGLVLVVLSGFQRYFCMQYTTTSLIQAPELPLYYQDFKDTFVCNTQRQEIHKEIQHRCIIRISKILLYAIHNSVGRVLTNADVVLSGFQRYFCMQYTTSS